VRFPKPDAVAAAVFALAGLALRLPLLGRSLWRDEGSTYADVATASAGTVLRHVWTNEMTPPFYFLLEFAWTHLAGTSEAMMRLPSLLFSIAGIAVMYALGRRAAGYVGGVVCAFCATFAPLSIDLGAQARAYALGIFLCALFLYAFVVSLEAQRPSRAWLAVLIVCAALLAATYGTGFVVVWSIALWSVAIALGDRSSGHTSLAVAAAAAAIAALLFVPFVTHAMNDWRGCCLHYQALDARIEDGLNAFSPFGVMYFQLDALLALAAFIWIATLPFRTRDTMDAIAAAMLTIVVLGISGGIVKNISPGQHLMIYAPAAWLLMAILCSRFGTWLGRVRSLKWLAAVPLGAALIAALIYYPSAYARMLRPISGARSAAEALASIHARPLLLVAAPDSLGPALYYYLRGDDSVLLRGLGKWKDPQFYSLDPAPWRAPLFVESEARRIERTARRYGAVIAFASNPKAVWYDGIPHYRAQSVVAMLKAKHGTMFARSFGGSLEPVDLIVLQPESR
jgi:hypothetical protein